MLKATPYEQSLNDDQTNFGSCKIFEAFHIQKIGPDFKSPNRHYCILTCHPPSGHLLLYFAKETIYLKTERYISLVLLIMFVIEYLNLI